MGDIAALGYLGLKGSIDAWVELAGIVGLETAPRPSESAVRFRTDERAWRIAVEAGEPGLGYIGWEVSSSAALNRVHDQLAAGGFLVRADPELARERGVQGLVTCQDPSEFCLEFFYGAEVSREPFLSPSGARFVTSAAGSTLGLGHVVLFVDDFEATTTFYMDLLGFEPTDSIIRGPWRTTFAHINSRHHSLAFGAAQGPIKRGFNHFMLEVDSLDAVGVALDRANASNIPVTVTLGKHTNDHMTSFYLRTPSACDLEYGCGGRLVDAAWVPTWFQSPSIWGHSRPDIPASAVSAP